MIRVEVQDYCQSCLEFEPDVENPTQFYTASEVVKQTDTVIRCEHRTRCENIKRYIDKEKEKRVNSWDRSDSVFFEGS